MVASSGTPTSVKCLFFLKYSIKKYLLKDSVKMTSNMQVMNSVSNVVD